MVGIWYVDDFGCFVSMWCCGLLEAFLSPINDDTTNERENENF